MRNFCLLFWVLLPFSLYAQTEKTSSATAPAVKSIKPLTATATATATVTRAVVIGISDYQDKDIPDLRFAHKDAEAFANFLRSPAGGSLEDDHLKVLTNTEATAGRIAEALDALIEHSMEGDQVIIYFSGHGDVEGKKISQPGFLLCWDSPSRVYMGGGTYSLSFLQEVVSTLSLQNKAKVIVITDACHAGKLAGSQISGAQLTSANLAKQYANEVKILSCQPNEYSLEGEQWGGGRGCFSYHFVDGLFGLADRNADGQVSVGEIDRYLEDKVTAEAAPQRQVPMLLGNKTERLATVNAQILADLKKAKSSGLPVFAATEGRGMEDEILAKLDSSIVKKYFAFKKAVAEKRFFEPADDCAETFYASLSKEPGLTPLQGYLKRNYAAALQDDAQQAMNTWLLASDLEQLEQLEYKQILQPIPRQLGRAAELLGESHYMHRSLNARKLLFEGILLSWTSVNPDEQLARRCLTLYRKSLALEPQSPLPWCYMSLVYVQKLRQPDSAFVCVRQAHNLAPNWVLPFVYLGTELSYPYHNKFELAKQVLQEADAIDSLHPWVIMTWVMWHSNQPGKANREKAVISMEKYRDNGGYLYSGWYNGYALALQDLGRYSESETAYLKAISMDSTWAVYWTNLGVLYGRTGRYVESESVLKKAISLDSSYFYAWNGLGALYFFTDHYVEAELVLKKAISLDSTVANAHKHLAMVCFKTNRLVDARQGFLKAIELNPNYFPSLLGMACLLASEGKTGEAIAYVEQAIAIGSTFEQLEQDEDLAPLRERAEWKVLMKKYFQDKLKE
ncbi:MAG: caspase family protein [Saprospiraceae bacterium]